MTAFWKLFLLGAALSFGPCLATCSPLVIPYAAGTRRSWRGGLAVTALFLLGRTVTYAGLGLAAGWGGMVLLDLLSGYRRLAYLIGGAGVAAAGVLVVSGRLAPEGKRCRRPSAAGAGGPFLFGLVTGVMPCAALLAVLGFIALEAAAPVQGALLGAAFGLGKFLSPILPLGVLAGAFPRLLPAPPRTAAVLRAVSGTALLLAGIYLVSRGW